MKKARVFYVFRRPVEKALQECTQRNVPEDNFYGLTKIKKSFDAFTTDKIFKHKTILLLQYIFNFFVTKFMDIGFSLIPTIFLIPELRQTDLVFATVDTYGMPIMLLKKLKLFKAPVIINTIGLYDGLIKKKSRLALVLCRNILKGTNHFISGGSFQECKKLSKLLRIPVVNFTFIPFGIDTDFFFPKKVVEKNEILIIGADRNRDWSLYQKIAYKLTEEKFRIITYKGLIKHPMPNNIIFEYNLSFLALRRRIWESKFILLLSKRNHYVSGQSTAFRCMSCGKAVIITKNPGYEEYILLSNKHIKTVRIENYKDVLSSINYLNTSITLRKKMGSAARKIIKNEYNLDQYAQKLSQVFYRILEQN